MKYTQKKTVYVSDADYSSYLSIPATFETFMDIATAESEVSGLSLMKLLSRNLFWVTVKTKVHFNRRPSLLETVDVSCWTNIPKATSVTKSYLVTQNDQVLITGKTQFALLETNTGRLHSLNDDLFKGIEVSAEESLTESFSRMDENFSNCECLGSYKVTSTDIDLGGHMNNCAYIKALFSLFSTKEISALKIRDLEIIYRTSAYEGQTLTFLKRSMENALEIGAFNEEGKAVILVKIS